MTTFTASKLLRTLTGAVAISIISATAAGCGGSRDEEKDESALAADAGSQVLLAPQVQAGDRYWDTVAVQDDPSFDGVMAMGRRDENGEPEELVIVERKTGAIAYYSVNDEAARPWDAVRDELSEVSSKLIVLAGDFDNGTTKIATFDGFVRDHACAIKFVGAALAVVGIVVAADLAIAAGVASAPAVIAGIEAQGLRAFATAAARTAIASPRVRALLAFKVTKNAAKAWLIFSEKGQQLTKPVRDAFHTVMETQCLPTAADATQVPPMNPDFVFFP